MKADDSRPGGRRYLQGLPNRNVLIADSARHNFEDYGFTAVIDTPCTIKTAKDHTVCGVTIVGTAPINTGHVFRTYPVPTCGIVIWTQRFRKEGCRPPLAGLAHTELSIAVPWIIDLF